MVTKLQDKDNFLVGVISDSHGVLLSEAVKALQGTDLIIHAGDIGKPGILAGLRSIAPVAAVRGNMDHGQWTFELPETQVVEVGEVLICVLHDIHELDIEPSAAGFSAVISGHTHKPSIDKHDDVLFLNPGSAASFESSASIALLHLDGSTLEAQLVMLKS